MLHPTLFGRWHVRLVLLAASLFHPLISQSAEVWALERFTHVRTSVTEPPIRTAAESLVQFLRARPGGADLRLVTVADSLEASTDGAYLLGTTSDTPQLARWVKEGRLHVSASEETGDAYEIGLIDGCVVVNGVNPRAVLYGVFELEDLIAAQGGIPGDLMRRATPSLGKRLLHPRVRGGFGSYRQSDFEFLARCGGNVAHLTHDWMKEKTLLSYVPSTEFPQASEAEALERNRDRLRQYLDWCELYGLDAAMWLTEIPCQGGPWVPEATRTAFLDHFPAECLSDTGTYQGKVLCLAHPRVEREYRRLVRQFLTDFPGISQFLVFTLDASGELCDPVTCQRHLGISKHTQYNRLLTLMIEEGRKVRPDFQAFSIGWGWKFRGAPDFEEQQAALPPGAGLTLPPDGEAWSFDRKTTDHLVQSRAVSREHGQAFLGYDIFLWGDDTVFEAIKDGRLPTDPGVTALYDFPLGIAAKLRRWQSLGADGFFDQWGTMAEYVQGNAVALRELVFYPQNTEPDQLDAWAGSLAARRFGMNAAPQVLAAWKEIEAAQQIQSDHVYFWHGLRPSWSGPALRCPLTLEDLQRVTPVNPEPPKTHGLDDFAPHRDDVSRARELAPALNLAADHFARALVHLQSATHRVEENRPTDLDHWYRPESGAPARFSPRQLLEEQIIAIRLQEVTQRRMSRFFQAWAIVKSLPQTGTSEHKAALEVLEKLRLADEEAMRAEN